MEYIEFLKTKQTAITESGFEMSENEINSTLFPFQKYCVRRALKAGRFAMFEDCGLGKTIQQLEWADKVQEYIGKPVIILAPLGVIGQTINEGA